MICRCRPPSTSKSSEPNGAPNTIVPAAKCGRRTEAKNLHRTLRLDWRTPNTETDYRGSARGGRPPSAILTTVLVAIWRAALSDRSGGDVLGVSKLVSGIYHFRYPTAQANFAVVARAQDRHSVFELVGGGQQSLIISSLLGGHVSLQSRSSMSTNLKCTDLFQERFYQTW